MNAQRWVLGNSQSAGPPVLPTRIHSDTHLKTHRHFNSHCCVGTNPHMHTKPHTFSQINTQSGISYTHIHMHSHTDKQLPRHTFSPSLPLSPSLSLSPSRLGPIKAGPTCLSLSTMPFILRVPLDPAGAGPRHQASLSFIISQSLFKLMSIELVIPSNHLILCTPLSSCLQSFLASGSFLMSWLSPSGGQSIGASASILPVNIQVWNTLGIDWFDLFAVHGALKNLLQHHSLNAPILWHWAFFMVQPSHPYMTTCNSKYKIKFVIHTVNSKGIPPKRQLSWQGMNSEQSGAGGFGFIGEEVGPGSGFMKGQKPLFEIPLVGPWALWIWSRDSRH